MAPLFFFSLYALVCLASCRSWFFFFFSTIYQFFFLLCFLLPCLVVTHNAPRNDIFLLWSLSIYQLRCLHVSKSKEKKKQQQQWNTCIYRVALKNTWEDLQQQQLLLELNSASFFFSLLPKVLPSASRESSDRKYVATKNWCLFSKYRELKDGFCFREEGRGGRTPLPPQLRWLCFSERIKWRAPLENEKPLSFFCFCSGLLLSLSSFFSHIATTITTTAKKKKKAH